MNYLNLVWSILNTESLIVIRITLSLTYNFLHIFCLYYDELYIEYIYIYRCIYIIYIKNCVL